MVELTARVGLRLSAGAFFTFLGINCLYLVNSVGE